MSYSELPHQRRSRHETMRVCGPCCFCLISEIWYLQNLKKKVFMFSKSLGATEWRFRPKRLLPEVFMQRVIFRAFCGMELDLTSILSMLSLPWRNSPYAEPDVRLESSLHKNNAGRKWDYYSEWEIGEEQFTVSQRWLNFSYMHLKNLQFCVIHSA